MTTTYNVEFKRNGEWFAQHTCVQSQVEVIDKAKAFWTALRSDGDRSCVRITQGLPFDGRTVATFTRFGVLRWQSSILG